MAVLGKSLIYKHCSGPYGEGVGGVCILFLSFYLLNQLTPFSSSLMYFYFFSLNYCHIFSINTQFPQEN